VTQQEALLGGFIAKGWGSFINKSFPGIPLNTNVSSLGLLIGFQVPILQFKKMGLITLAHHFCTCYIHDNLKKK
jgi:hypothetical protein